MDSSVCQCKYSGYTFRAYYDAPRFGGLNNSACNGLAQLIVIEFQYSTKEVLLELSKV